MNVYEILQRAPENIAPSETPGEDKLRAANEADGDLGGTFCPKCRNKGFVLVSVNGALAARECDCANARRAERRIERSGLRTLLSEYTFDTYKTPDDWQKALLAKAREFADGAGTWFVISGKPGSGKTHICTAICGAMIAAGKDVRYMVWREEAPRLKALVNDREQYEKHMDELKRCDVLYIDDFWKGAVTDADINLSFELLNARYNDSGRRTVISGERSIEQIMDVDAAIGSRIYQRSEGFRFRTDGINRRIVRIKE